MREHSACTTGWGASALWWMLVGAVVVSGCKRGEAGVTEPPDITLPRVTVDASFPREAVVVVVSPHDVRVPGWVHPVNEEGTARGWHDDLRRHRFEPVENPAIFVPPEAGRDGFDGRDDERRARRESFDVAVIQALSNTLQVMHPVEAVAPRDRAGIVFADAEAPYAVVFETLRVAFGPSDHVSFVARNGAKLGAVPAMIRTAAYEATLAEAGKHVTLVRVSRSLLVELGSDGMVVETTEGRVGAGCDARGEGRAVRGTDLRALGECTRKLAVRGEIEGDSLSLRVRAEPSTPFAVVLGVFEAVREAKVVPEGGVTLSLGDPVVHDT